MIWYNGRLQWKTNPNKAFLDENGDPIVQEAQWSEPIQCGYVENSTLTAKSGEQSDYIQKSYSVSVKKQEPRERIKLFDKSGKLLGEFVVRSCKQYEYIDETHLEVSN